MGWGGGGGAMGTGKRCTEGGKAGTLVKRVGGGWAAPAPPPASTPGDCAPASRRRPCARLWPRPSKKKKKKEKRRGTGAKRARQLSMVAVGELATGPRGELLPPLPRNGARRCRWCRAGWPKVGVGVQHLVGSARGGGARQVAPPRAAAATAGRRAQRPGGGEATADLSSFFSVIGHSRAAATRAIPLPVKGMPALTQARLPRQRSGRGVTSTYCNGAERKVAALGGSPWKCTEEWVLNRWGKGIPSRIVTGLDRSIHGGGGCHVGHPTHRRSMRAGCQEPARPPWRPPSSPRVAAVAPRCVRASDPLPAASLLPSAAAAPLALRAYGAVCHRLLWLFVFFSPSVVAAWERPPPRSRCAVCLFLAATVGGGRFHAPLPPHFPWPREDQPSRPPLLAFLRPPLGAGRVVCRPPTGCASSGRCAATVPPPRSVCRYTGCPAYSPPFPPTPLFIYRLFVGELAARSRGRPPARPPLVSPTGTLPPLPSPPLLPRHHDGVHADRRQ